MWELKWFPLPWLCAALTWRGRKRPLVGFRPGNLQARRGSTGSFSAVDSSCLEGPYATSLLDGLFSFHQDFGLSGTAALHIGHHVSWPIMGSIAVRLRSGSGALQTSG